MKTKGKMLYLVLAIILFIVLLIPLFQNVTLRPIVMFFGGLPKPFTSVYMPLMTMCIIEGALITLYVQSLLSDTRKQDATKFDLSN